jgi:hypothetical protein
MTEVPVRLHHLSVSVKADDQRLYFEVLGMHAHGRKKVKLTFQGAAEPFRGIGHPAASSREPILASPGFPYSPLI